MPPWTARWLLLLALGAGACRAPAPARAMDGTVRLAAAGASIPVSKGGQPPTSVFPGDKLPPPGTVVTCPVCGDEFAIEEGRPMRHYKGKVVIFCCQRCLPHFDKNPDMFVGPGI